LFIILKNRGRSYTLSYDVVVVGAGPAGSTAAKFLSENNVKVLLVDKSKFPRDKPCGGGIPVRSLKKFKYIEEKNLIESYSHGGCLHSTSPGCRLEIAKNKPLIAMVLRKKFDNELVKLAIENGTTFFDGKKVQIVNILDSKVIINFSDGSKIETKMVIGADGVWSTVAKQCKLSNDNKNVGLSLFQEIPISTKVLDKYYTKKRVSHVYMKVQDIIGYGWVFPKKKHINIGICEFKSLVDKSSNKVNLKNVYSKFIEILKQEKMIPENIEMGPCRGAALPLRPLPKTYTNRVILCGDAAGLINPATGEGIDYAMSSGKIAASVIIDAIEKNDMSEKFLSKYELNWKKDFGKDIKIFLKAQKGWTTKGTKLIQLASKDKRISEIAVEVATGNLSASECKFELISRLLFLYFKNLLHINR
jgi:geranylgeranyl reductase family protein